MPRFDTDEDRTFFEVTILAHPAFTYDDKGSFVEEKGGAIDKGR